MAKPISIARCLPLGMMAALAITPVFAAPSVYPVGTTIYTPAETWNGYTVLSLLREPGMVVIDMNGRVVKQWEGFNSSAGGPVRLLPNGEVIGAAGAQSRASGIAEACAEGFQRRPALGAPWRCTDRRRGRRKAALAAPAPRLAAGGLSGGLLLSRCHAGLVGRRDAGAGACRSHAARSLRPAA